MVVALCLLGFAGCSEEEMPVKDSKDGAVVLRLEGDIAVDAETSDPEEYVKTLRLIGVSNDGTVAFNYYLDEDDLSGLPVQGQDPYKYIEIPLEGENALPSGAYTIYSVANEEVESLSLANISASDLTLKMITAKSSYNKPSADNLILMSAIYEDVLIDPNNQSTTIMIGLVRVLAKIGVGTIKQGAEEITDYSYMISVNGNVYESYPLFEGTGSGTTAIDIDSNNAPVYLSESGIDLEVSLSVTIDGITYTGVCDEDIIPKRNTFYQLNGTIDEQSQCLLLNISVAPWEVVALSPTYE